MFKKTPGPYADRLPPGQHPTEDLPVLHYGTVPKIDIATWRLRVFGEVDRESSFDFEELRRLPLVDVTADIHCVTTWTKLDARWRGVPFSEIHELCAPRESATYVLVHGAPDYTTGVPLDVLLGPDVILATEYDGRPLTLEHGWPVRLVVPKLYFYKSAKWVTGIEYLSEPKLGFWERSGYSETADPWREERYA